MSYFQDRNQFFHFMLCGRPVFFCFALILLYTYSAMSQTNYDEEKVPEYQLPDVLVTHDGQKVSDKEQWENLRRPEIMELFSKEMFGDVPDVEVDFDFEVTKHIAGDRKSTRLNSSHVAI